MSDPRKFAEGADELSATNMAAMETLIADTMHDLEEDKIILDRLRSGADVREILDVWISRAVRQQEARIRDINEYRSKVEEGLRKMAEASQP